MSRFARREFKRHFPHVIHDEERRKWLARFGNKFVQEIRFIVGKDLLRLGRFDRLLQDLFADLEFARLFVRLRFLTEVSGFGVKNFPAPTVI